MSSLMRSCSWAFESFALSSVELSSVVRLSSSTSVESLDWRAFFSFVKFDIFSWSILNLAWEMRKSSCSLSNFD